MRITLRSAVVVALCAAAVALFVLLNPGEKEKTSAQQAAPETTQGAPVATEPASTTTAATSPDTPAAVNEFVAAYADEAPDDAAWAQSLAPHTTAALHASLVSSDRGLAQSAGTQILDVSDTTVTVGDDGQPTYTLTIAPVDSSHEHDGQAVQEEEEEWVVTGIDFADPPEGVALPLGAGAVEDLRPTIQDALTAVIAQPGGQTAQERQSVIRDVFTDPQTATSIPRSAAEGEAVRIGNAHEIVLSAEEGQLLAYVTVPYAADGTEEPSWTTVTIELTRDTTGNWVPQDARI